MNKKLAFTNQSLPRKALFVGISGLIMGVMIMAPTGVSAAVISGFRPFMTQPVFIPGNNFAIPRHNDFRRFDDRRFFFDDHFRRDVIIVKPFKPIHRNFIVVPHQQVFFHR